MALVKPFNVCNLDWYACAASIDTCMSSHSTVLSILAVKWMFFLLPGVCCSAGYQLGPAYWQPVFHYFDFVCHEAGSAS